MQGGRAETAGTRLATCWPPGPGGSGGLAGLPAAAAGEAGQQGRQALGTDPPRQRSQGQQAGEDPVTSEGGAPLMSQTLSGLYGATQSSRTNE